MGGTRALLRGLRESVFSFPEGGICVLVIGAGDACRFLLNEIRRNRQWNLRPVAILDDDRRKHGKSILGIPIVGSLEQLSQALENRKIEQIIIAIPSAQPAERLLIERRCADLGVPFVTMYSLQDTLVYQISKQQEVKP
jgi:FlaA1/EpsC-like NDP-sugar epimerase